MLAIQTGTTTVYRIHFVGRYGNEHSGRFYTRAAMLRHLAWWMIWDKYQDPWEPNNQVIVGRKAHCKTYTHPTPEPCCCGEDGDWGLPMRCPLHDTETGWFRRLHTRLTRYLSHLPELAAVPRELTTLS